MPINFYKRFAPKDIILATLVSLLIISATLVGWEKVTLQVIVCISTAIFVDLFLNFLKKTKYFFPKAAVITGLIIALVLPVQVEPLIAFLTTFIAIFSKQFIKVGRNHIFNPAAFGLVTAALLFKIPFGWWGDNIFWLTLALGSLAVLRAKKELQVFGFILTYFLIQYWFTKIYFPKDVETLKTAFATIPWFFALFMVPEPMTSLLPYRLTTIFGILAAFAAFGLGFVKINAISTNSLVLGLLLANLLTFLYIQQKRKK